MATDLTPTYYRPTLHGPSRSYCPLAWASGALLPGWPVKDLFLFDGAEVNLSARVNANAVEDGNGFIASGIDGDGFIWLLSVDGQCFRAASPSPQVTLGVFVLGKDQLGYQDSAVTDINEITLVATLPYGGYVGACTSGTDSGLYVISADGSVFLVGVGSYEKIGTFPAAARSPLIYDGYLCAVVPSSGVIARMDLGSGVVTTQNCGIGNPAFCYWGPQGFWAAGTNPFTMSEADLGINLGTSGLGVAFTSSSISLISGSDPDITVISTTNISGSVIDVVFAPDVNEALVLTDSALLVYTIESQVLTLTQTLTISDATAVSLGPTQDRLFVATTTDILVFTESLGVWAQASDTFSTGGTALWSGVTSVSTDNDPTVICGSGSTSTIFAASGSTWSSDFSIVSEGAVIAYAGDGTDVAILSTSTSGDSSVTLIDFSSKSAGPTFSLPGAPLGVTYLSSGDYAVLTKNSEGVRTATILTLWSGNFISAGSTAVPGSGSNISWTGTSLWVSGSQYQKGAPGAVMPVSTSQTSFSGTWGSSFKTWDFGRVSKPSGILAGSSNIIVTFAGNVIITQDLSGGEPVEYDLSVFSGQNDTTPMNLAGVVLGSNSILFSTSASGEIGVISEDW